MSDSGGRKNFLLLFFISFACSATSHISLCLSGDNKVAFAFAFAFILAVASIYKTL
jgi:hypothetical protein